ncbi:MAG: MATE family efflux transporter [Clostridiales bacterium]|nr:MATE family efflux transporter [Clostridiales bacterium]
MTKDLTSGSPLKVILLFSLPLVLGNLFQQFYALADTIIVGRFCGVSALASVGATGSVNYLILGFVIGVCNGFAIPIAQLFGARDYKDLRRHVANAAWLCMAASVVLTISTVALTRPMMQLMQTPDDIIDGAVIYIGWIFAGIPFIFLYNMVAAIMRALGDSKTPLYFLILTSALNIGLDLLFVVGFGMAIEGVAYATIISQFVSAALVLVVLSRSTESYRLTWRDLRIDKGIFKQILRIGLPTGFQQSLTSFSNVYVQSYINTFGSSCMAGWSSYSKIDQFVFLPMQSIGQASTTFMSQNLGAGNLPRAKKGTGVAMRLALIITFASAAVLFLFAPSLVAIFNQEPDVVRYGTMFLRMNVFMLAFCCPNQVVAGAMRGAGDSRTPMLIMLFSFVLFRQIYLYIATSICNTAAVVGFGYPIGWIVASILVELYYMSGKWEKKISM